MSDQPPTVSLICSAFLAGADADRRAASLASLLFALVAQSRPDWECVVVLNSDDAPGVWRLKDVLRAVGDERVRHVVMPEHDGSWGHRWRRPVALAHTTGKYVGLLNDDTWVAPAYLDRLAGLLDGGCDLALCNFILGHAEPFPAPPPYRVVLAEPRVGCIGVAAWLARRELIEATAWADYGRHGDGHYVEALAHGHKVARCPQVLCSYN